MPDPALPTFRTLLAQRDPSAPFSVELLEAAHRESISHKAAVLESPVSACFHCLRLFPSTEIREWVRSSADREDLSCAVCPFCSVDSVLPSSTVELTDELLRAMNTRWFYPHPQG